MTQPTAALLEGLISVRAALHAGSRPIHTIYVDRERWDPEIDRLLRAANKAGVPVQRVGRAEIDAMAQGSTHGGVAATVGERRFAPLETLIEGTPQPFIAMLDGIEDPFNFGSAVRSLYAAGADGLLLRARNWMSAAGTVARASAGASELFPAAITEDAGAAIQLFRSRRMMIACASEQGSRPMYEIDLSGPIFLLIGGEKRGIHKSLLKQADVLLRIPYGRRFGQALDTASATTVLAFEIMRQRIACSRST